MARALIETSRWVLLALLVFAPWAFGSTRLWAIDWLNRGLAVMLLVRLLAIPFGGNGRFRELPRALLAGVAGVLILGWWMTLNARAVYDAGRRDLRAAAGARAFRGGRGRCGDGARGHDAAHRHARRAPARLGDGRRFRLARPSVDDDRR